MENNELCIEEAFAEIEKVIEQLEDDSISLEASFEVYKRGMELLKVAGSKIDHVEKKVLEINSAGEVDEFE